MTRFALPVLLLAGVAILLPWQRCHGACHDEVTPLGGGHDCHGEECPEEPGDEPEHEALSLELLAPKSPVAVEPGLVETVGPVVVMLESLENRTEATPAFPSPPPFPETDVLLL